MAASASDLFQEVGTPGTATTLSSPGYTIGNTSITVGSTAGWPTTTGVTFAIDRAEVINGVETRIDGTYCEFVGTVASGTSITNVSKVYGTAQDYASGALTRVYIPVSSERENRLVEGMLAEHTQTGTHSMARPKVTTSIDDTNGNELLKVTATTSAVNEFTVANAATGDSPSLSATGGDTNINVNLVPKGSGTVDKSGNPIDWWEELGRTTLGSTSDTITVSSLAERSYIKIVANIRNSGTLSNVLRFNNDSGNNYAYRYSGNGGADTTATSTSGIFADGGANNVALIFEVTHNTAATEKIVVGRTVAANAAGAANLPGRNEVSGKWANTSAAISRVDIVNSGGGDFASGSEVIVLGHN